MADRMWVVVGQDVIWLPFHLERFTHTATVHTATHTSQCNQ
jgi:hypothetical protein